MHLVRVTAQMLRTFDRMVTVHLTKCTIHRPKDYTSTQIQDTLHVYWPVPDPPARNGVMFCAPRKAPVYSLPYTFPIHEFQFRDGEISRLQPALVSAQLARIYTSSHRAACTVVGLPGRRIYATMETSDPAHEAVPHWPLAAMAILQPEIFKKDSFKSGEFIEKLVFKPGDELFDKLVYYCPHFDQH